MSIIETELLELAAKPKSFRRVRTIEGAEFYGLPIGSLITAEVVAKKNAQAQSLGIKPPTGSLSKPAGSVALPDMAPTASGEESSSVKAAPKSGGKFKVGSAEYDAPDGARLIRPKTKGDQDVAYTFTKDGKVFAYTEEGETALPTLLAKALAKRFSKDLTDDPEYEEDEFDNAPEAIDVADLPIGSTLVGRGDNIQFEKQENGDWKHSSGVVVSDDDLQHLVDSGELEAEEPDEDELDEEEPDSSDASDDSSDASDASDDSSDASEEEDAPEFTPGSGDYPTKPKLDQILNAPMGAKALIAVGDAPDYEDLIEIQKTGFSTWTTPQGSKYANSDLSAIYESEVEDLDDLNEEIYFHKDNPVPKKPGEIPAKTKEQTSFDVPDTEWMKAQPKGMKISVQHSDTKHWKPFVSDGKGNWANPKAGIPLPAKSFQGKIDSGKAKYDTADLEKFSTPDEPAAPAAPEAPAEKPAVKPMNAANPEETGDMLLPEDVEAKAVGQYVISYSGNYFHRLDDDKWAFADEDMPSWMTTKDLKDLAGAGGVFEYTPKTSPVEEPAPVALPDYVPAGSTPVTDPADVPVGGHVMQGEDASAIILRKTGPNVWIDLAPDMGFAWSDNNLKPAAITGSLWLIPEDAAVAPAAPVEPEETPEVPEPETISFKVGDEPTAKFIEEAEEGAVISYASPGKFGTWTKFPSGWKNSNSGATVDDYALAKIQVNYSATNTYSIEDLGGVKSDAAKLEVGDTIPSYEVLKELPEGYVLSRENAFVSRTYVKTPAGWMNDLGALVSDEHMEVWADDAKLLVHTKPIAISAPEASAPAPTPEPTPQAAPPAPVVPATPGKTKLWDGGPDFDNADVLEALTALEAHSSFQVKYGLKSVPNNPLADSYTVEVLKDAGAAAFPDLKPKKAVIALLQTKLGMTPAVEEKKQTLATGPSVQIGSADPQDTATGKTGGVFTVSEMEDAVAILEAYSGKLFKAELNKKDNPLGALNFNDIVGFDKDKTVVKQKVIDLLKKKISDNKVEPTPEPETEEPDLIGELLTKLAKEQYEEEMKNPTPVSVPAGPSPDLTGKFYTADSSDHFLNNIGADIQKVHKLPEGVTPPKVEYTASLNSAHGSDGAAGTFSGSSNVIKISEKDLNAEGTILHEYGHFLDTKVLGGVSSKPSNSKFAGFWVAINNSKTWEMISEKSPKPAYHGAPSEVFARAYTQWVGAKVGDIHYKLHAPSSVRWTDEQFEPISKAMDKLFLDAGLLNSDAKTSVPSYAVTPTAVTAKTSEDSADGPELNKSGLTPGKYSAGGKVHMIVKADGTGVYVNSKGEGTAMTVAKVKSNHAAGMNQYMGMPDSIPEVKTKPVAKKAKTVADIPDGTYYGGSSLHGKTTVYEVSGDTVKVFAPGAQDVKNWLGAPTNGGWIDAAKVGSKMYYSGSTYSESDLSFHYELKADGKWYSLKGEEISAQSLDSARKSWSSYIISGVGKAEVDPIPKAKLKTMFLKGKLLDASGNSVLPEGYSGEVTLLGSPTGIAQLTAAQKMLDGWTMPKGLSLTADLKQTGVMIDQLLVAKAFMDSGLEPTPENKAAVVKSQIDALLQGVAPVEPTEADKNFGFKFNSAGDPMPPGAMVQLMTQYQYDTSSLTNFIKDASASFGDGKTIGLHRTKMDKYQKSQWVEAFKDGNFRTMYEVEVEAAAKDGKGHGSGPAHPGYVDNTETHTIKWGAAVDGELSASTEIEGEWSGKLVKPSLEEIDNYLIKAQMQNPEHLSIAEKREWVRLHRAESTNYVNTLSMVAQVRAKEGHAPKTSTPVWTENVVPAKSYDHLFDDTQFPVTWTAENSQVTVDYITDHAADLGDFFEANGWNGDDIPSIAPYAAMSRLKVYFQQKQTEWDIEEAKPKFKKLKLIDEESTHKVWMLSDQHDKRYAFKSAGSNVQRAHIEHQANVIAKSWGFNSGATQVNTIDGDEGFVQEFVDNVSNFHGKNGDAIQFSSLDGTQLGKVAAEHVLDWILDNDDSHRGNLLLKPDADIVGIDKGRAFFRYGDWNGMSGDGAADSNAALAYTAMYNDIRKGKITEENAHAAYKAAMKAAKRIEKASDSDAEAKLREGLEGRVKWPATGQVGHFSGKQLPRNADEMVAAFLERKHSLQETTKAMWEGIFKDAGYSMPVPPKLALGENHHSGWEEDNFIPEVLESKVHGKAALHASGGIVDGSSLVWTEKTNGGGQLVSGQVKIGKLTQQKLVTHLDAQALQVTTASSNASEPLISFPNMSVIKKVITTAAKDHTKKLQNQEPLDKDVQEALAELEAKLLKDHDFFYGELPEPDNDFYTAPGTGLLVHRGSVQQYAMAVDHYQTMIELTQKAKADKTVTNKYLYTAFTPQTFMKTGAIYLADNGDSYTQLYNGHYLHHSKTVGATEVTTSLPPEVTAEGSSFKKVGDIQASATAASVKYYKETSVFHGGTLDKDGSKTASDTKSDSGTYGTHYRIDLPTGEEIIFQNSDSTGTAESQRGTIRFRAVGGPAAHSESLGRIAAQLELMGLSMEGAQEEDAELIYWRQMFNTVAISNVTSAPDAIQKARSVLDAKRESLSSEFGHLTVFDTMEAISLSFEDRDQELAYLRELADTTWGATKVADFLSEEKHLPRYNNLDISASEKNLGHPIYTRIDVDMKAIYAKNTLIAIGNHSKDEGLLNYITTGQNISTEERLRVMGHFKSGTSSSSDQSYGSAGFVFTRVAKPGSEAEFEGALFGKHVMYFSPELLAQTSAYAFQGDNYGQKNMIPNSTPYDPMQWLNNGGVGNEALFKNGISMLNYMEIMVFSNAQKRDEAIQRLKAQGIETIRGLPIEERLVMRAKLVATMTKVKEQWTK